SARRRAWANHGEPRAGVKRARSRDGRERASYAGRHMWKRIMIAQPGEAAARVARTFKRLGITAIALAPSTRPAGPHVDACDELILLDPREDGSLDPAEIVREAQAREVEAIYSAFGLGEAELQLARALESADLPYVGADPDALALS